MTEEKGNFRGVLFGGFNRGDVIAYIEKLAAERNTLIKDKEELEVRVEALEQKIEELECAPSPGAPVNEIRLRCEEIISVVKVILEDISKQYDSICSDITINVTQAAHELSRISAHTAGLTASLSASGEKLGALSEKLSISELYPSEEE